MKTKIAELVGAYRSGNKSPREALEEVAEGVAAASAQNAFISSFSLESMLEALTQRDPSLPLYGVPFSVKDNIDVRGLPTTAACPSFKYFPTENAPVVERLCQAGAIVVGKTNMDQFATGLVGTRSPYGECRSVFNSDYISGGSSSGSAVSVALGLSTFSLGTDTAGSGRVPAAFNNLVGLKPTRGLVSTRGVVPACRTLDCVSLFAHSVADAKLLLNLVSGVVPLDPFARPASFCVGLGDGPARLAVPRTEDLEFFGDSESAELFAAAVKQAQGLGWKIESFSLEPFLEAARLLYSGPWVAERLAPLESFLKSAPAGMDSVVHEILLGGHRHTAVDTFRAQHRLSELKLQVAPILAHFDALLLPTAPTHYRVAEVLSDPITLNARLGTYTNFVNLLDLSALAIPAGFRKNGLPFGVTLMGPAFAEPRLLELGERFLGEGSKRERSTGAVWLAVAGAHLSGQPLNHELTSRGARRIQTCKTSSDYQLFALATTPPKPGLVRTPGKEGHAIEVEVWELSAEAFGSFVAQVPEPMTIGVTTLSDGTQVKGFNCESYALEGARNISEFGGWRAFRAGRPE